MTANPAFSDLTKAEQIAILIKFVSNLTQMAQNAAKKDTQCKP